MGLSRHRVLAVTLCACSLLALACLPGYAIDVVRLTLATLEGPGWSARAVTLQLTPLDNRHAAVALQARLVSLPEGLGQVSGLDISCARARLTRVSVHCNHALLEVKDSELGPQRVRLAFDYQLESGRIEAELQGLRLQGGSVNAAVRLADSGWQLDADASQLSLAPLIRQLSAAGVAMPVVEGSGEVGLVIHAQGEETQLREIDIALQLQTDEISDADGTLAAEGLVASMQVNGHFSDKGMQGQLSLEGHSGALYVDPLYMELSSLQASTRFDWHADSRQLTLHAFSYDHPGSVQLTGTGMINMAADAPVRDLHITIHDAVFPSLFTTYLQPWLFDTGFAELETSGKLNGVVDIEQGVLARFSIIPRELSVDDIEGRFSLDAVNGELRWSATPAVQRSMLSWSRGSFFDVALGPASLVLDAGHDHVQLVQPVGIPVLDGLLRIDDFEMAFSEDRPLSWQVNGLLEPVSLSDLSLALGWPELAGRLSGVIPNVHYEGGDLEVGGILLIRVFDGEVTLRNLTMEQPFGLVPRLEVDARVDNIDLETLTRTFSFGRIEGRLDGRIDGLDMESWRPVSFDAEFATPVDDRSRHRISQKAVDNISSIGGAGVGGALSRSFLRFFEDFPYDRLGIRCRLENGICDMGGIAPAPDGYYLVKGRMIPPRLDVIGYADRVNWETLMAQIMAVTSQQDVVVE